AVTTVDVGRTETRVRKACGEHSQREKFRDIFFKDHEPFPAPSHEILMSSGYKIFWFEEHLRGPKVIPPVGHARRRQYDLPPSFVATREPARLERLFSDAGWKSF